MPVTVGDGRLDAGVDQVTRERDRGTNICPVGFRVPAFAVCGFHLPRATISAGHGGVLLHGSGGAAATVGPGVKVPPWDLAVAEWLRWRMTRRILAGGSLIPVGDDGFPGSGIDSQEKLAGALRQLRRRHARRNCDTKNVIQNPR